MKMNAKGFTLIELLAVIVILAVIALIATPLIMGVIDDAKEGAGENTAYGYVKAAENAIATTMIKDTTFKPAANQCDMDAIKGTGVITSAPVDIKGTKPEQMKLVIKNGVVAEGSLIKVNGKIYKMDAKSKFSKATETAIPTC